MMKMLIATALFAVASVSTAASCVPPASGAAPVINTGLPVVQIWTQASAPILNREDYVAACMRITDGTVNSYKKGLFEGTIKIRGRGNSTWEMPKKPYRIKLDTAAPILDMPAHKDWVLLANYADKSLLRTAAAMELGRILKMPWTPRLRFADVYLNDEFLGNYQLGEKVEVSPDRVALTEMGPGDITGLALTGGYLLENEFLNRIDVNKDPYFTINPSTAFDPVHFVLVEPSGSDLRSEHIGYIRHYISTVDAAIMSNNKDPVRGWPALIDLDSFLDYFIVQEITKNVDSPMRSSVYYMKDRGGKLKLGPIWDFDLSSGNVDYEPDVLGAKDWYVRKYAPWFNALMADPEVRQRLKVRWDAAHKELKEIDKFVQDTAKTIDKSQEANFARWPILGTYVWPNSVVFKKHKDEVKFVKDFLKKRVEWLDKNIGKE